MQVSWSRLALGLTLVLALKFHLSQLLDPWHISGDACQHVFWTYRFADPELFPGDLLVRFISSPRFDPPGYVAIYAVGARVLDALLFSKILAFLLCLVTGWSAYRVGRRFGGPVAGFVAVAAMGLLLFDDLRGGLPRSFAFPLLLLFLDGLVHRRAWVCGAALVLCALLYPPMVMTTGPLLPLLLLDGRRVVWSRIPELILPVALPAVLAAGIVFWSQSLADPELTGPLVSRQEARSMPEFHSGGRSKFWNPDPVAFWLGDWTYNRSACGLLSKMVFIPLCLALALLVVRGRRFRCPAELGLLLASGLVMFLVAHGLLFLLYLPSRYTLYAWPVGLTLLAVVNATPLLEKPLRRVALVFRGWRGVAVLILLLIALVGANLLRGRSPPPEAWRDTLEALSGLPKDACIAGLPHQMDAVPLRTRRSVLANQELALAWYTGYHEQIRGRIEASLQLVFARERSKVIRLAERFGVTHLVVDRQHFGLPEDELRALVDKPYQDILIRLRSSGTAPLFAGDQHGFSVAHQSGPYTVLALEDR